MKKPYYLLLITGSYYYMFFMGAFVAIRGALLPIINQYFQISYTATGFIFLIGLAPGLLGNLYSGYIFNILNKKLILILGSILMLVFSLSIPFASNYILFLLFTFLLGFGVAVCATGSNIAVSDAFNYRYPKYKKNGINILHFFFSFGTIIPLTIFTLFKGKTNNWQMPYLLLGISSILIVSAYFFSRYPPIKEHPNKSDYSFKHYKKVLFNSQMIYYMIIVFLYAGIEMGIISWVSTYLCDGFSYTKDYSDYILLLFFIFFTIGRLLGSFLIHKFNAIKLLFLLLFLEACCIILGFVFKIQIFNMDLFISLSGLFLSLIFPLVQNCMLSDFKEEVNTATSLYYASCSLGINFLVFIIGFFNDKFGPRTGILVTGVYVILIIPFLILVTKNKINYNTIKEC